MKLINIDNPEDQRVARVYGNINEAINLANKDPKVRLKAEKLWNVFKIAFGNSAFEKLVANKNSFKFKYKTYGRASNSEMKAHFESVMYKNKIAPRRSKAGWTMYTVHDDVFSEV